MRTGISITSSPVIAAVWRARPRFADGHNFAKRLKTFRGLTPYEHVCNVWTTQTNRFKLNPLFHTVGLN